MNNVQQLEKDTLTAFLTLNGTGMRTDHIRVDLRGQDSARAGPAGVDQMDCTNGAPIAVSTYMEGQKGPMITFFVRTGQTGSETLTLEMSPDAFVQDLKKELVAKMKMHNSQFWLSFRGQPMEDGRKLCFYEIDNYCTVDMNFRLRGGTADFPPRVRGGTADFPPRMRGGTADFPSMMCGGTADSPQIGLSDLCFTINKK